MTPLDLHRLHRANVRAMKAGIVTRPTSVRGLTAAAAPPEGLAGTSHTASRGAGDVPASNVGGGR